LYWAFCQNLPQLNQRPGTGSSPLTAPAAQLLLQDQEVAATHGHLDSPKYKRAVQMSFRMITPRRSRSGSVKARKVIPRDVREDYARLYGVSSEAKPTVPAGTPVHEAKIRASEFLAEVETRIATIRAAQKGEGQSLSQRQAFALAGEWYVWYVGRHEENPGTPKQWNDLWVALIERLEDHAAEYVLGHGWRDLDWTREPQVLEGIRPQIADEAKTAQFLASKGVVLNSEAQSLFLDCVLPEFIAAILRLERVASGNYEADERPSQ